MNQDISDYNTYFIELSYLGTNYHGWQRQKNASSVQELLEEALSKVLNQKIEVTGSSRTDTGVHALQQFAHFSLGIEGHSQKNREELDEEDHLRQKDIPILNVKKVTHQLNCLLPRDIAIKNLYQVQAGAHSRFDAISRTYQYWIIGEKNPFLINRALYLNIPLDIEILNKACVILQNNTNFKSFTKTKTQVNNYNCKIEYARWYHSEVIRDGLYPDKYQTLLPQVLVFEIKSNRFLRSMVRNIVGTMIEVGSNKISLEQFEQIISSRDVRLSGKCISPDGLYLTEVGYPIGKL
jgi:tRNA pseudouridine38-40 synthase